MHLSSSTLLRIDGIYDRKLSLFIFFSHECFELRHAPKCDLIMAPAMPDKKFFLPAVKHCIAVLTLDVHFSEFVG